MAPTAAQGVVPDQGVDRISDLPDELLCAVVSSLPAKDGARTMVLSRRWSSLWLSAPLILDDGEFVRPRRQVEYTSNSYYTSHASCPPTAAPSAGFASAASATHPPPPVTGYGRRRSTRSRSSTSATSSWNFGPRQNRLPSSALRFSELRVASYGGCEFPDDLGCVTFLKLRELTLYQLRISDSALHAMISACPALGSLLLVDNNGVRRVRISSPRLVRLGISVIEARRRSSVVMKELIIVNAPSMEKLLLFRIDGGLKNIHVKFAPKLEVLGCLSSNMLKVQLESTVFQKLVSISPVESMQTVKSFSLMAKHFKLDNVMDFLRCFPCLEKLYFMMNDRHCFLNYLQPISSWEDESGQLLNSGPSIECLDRRLKEIVLINYEGSTGGANLFATFFLMNARVLRMMEVQVPFYCTTKWRKWKAEQKRALPKRKDWACPVAKLNFVHRSYFEHHEDEYITQELLSYDNPFGYQL